MKPRFLEHDSSEFTDSEPLIAIRHRQEQNTRLDQVDSIGLRAVLMPENDTA
jgi:hypothetical protein